MDLSWLLGRIFIILGRDRVIIIIGDCKSNFNVFFHSLLLLSTFYNAIQIR